MTKSSCLVKPVTNERLNKGEDCNLSLLQCVQILCSRPLPRSHHFPLDENEQLNSNVSQSSILEVQAEFTHQMFQTMDGACLIARLV